MQFGCIVSAHLPLKACASWSMVAQTDSDAGFVGLYWLSPKPLIAAWAGRDAAMSGRPPGSPAGGRHTAGG